MTVPEGFTADGVEPEVYRTAIARLISVAGAGLERQAQLEHALESRVAIEQAKGVLSERFGITVEEAFELVRRASRNQRVPAREVAREILASRETPPSVVDARGE